MPIDFNTPEQNQDQNSVHGQSGQNLASQGFWGRFSLKGKGIGLTGLELVLVWVSILLSLASLCVFGYLLGKIHPKTPVIVQCSESDMQELKRSSDLLDSIQKGLKIKP